MGKIFSVVIAFLLLVFSSGQSFSRPSNGEYLIAAGDRLRITFTRNHELNTRRKVDRKGNITVVFLGKVNVAKLTATQASEKLTELFADGYLVEPEISVTVPSKSKRSAYTSAKQKAISRNRVSVSNFDQTGNEVVLFNQIYEVQKGDTLGSIAKKVYGKSSKWVLLAEANDTLFPDGNYAMLTQGMQLVILPAGKKMRGLKSPVIAAPIPVDITEDYYTIRPGDTLGTIAEQFYGDPRFWRKIFDLNKDRLPNPNNLEKGQRLRIH